MPYANIDGEATLNASNNGALDGFFVVVGVADLVPDLEAFRLLLGQNQLAIFALDFFDENFDGISDGDCGYTLFRHEFPGGNHSLGLKADVDLNEIVVDRKDLAFRDLPLFEG